MELNNGIEMPQLGIGTFMISSEDAEKSVYEALKIGYRLIDTAGAYANERAVGRAIKKSGIPRNELFVSSKLWVTEYNNPNAVEETLERLGLDYIDLLYIHQCAGDYLNGYKLIEKAYKDGKVKAIGISNAYGDDFDKIIENAIIKPQVLQVERHPYYVGKDMESKVKENDLKIMAWYPLGHGDKNLLEEDIFKSLSKKYGKTPAQIILRWHIQMGNCIIPGSKNINHIKDNYNIFDFELTNSDMLEIAKIDSEKKYFEFNNDFKKVIESMSITYEEK